MRRRAFIAASAAGLAMAAKVDSFGQGEAKMADANAGYASVNGLKMYYEVHGSGDPLVLLHGGLSSGGMFEGSLLPALAKVRRVITVDLQGHGRTGDADRPLTCEGMASDVAEVLKSQSIEKADVMGYSLGAAVALNVAFAHPELLKRLVVVSTTYGSDGWYPEVLEAMKHLNAAAAEMMKPSPAYQTYAKIAPRPADWPVLVEKTGDLLRKPYDWSKQVAAIGCPTLLAFGDADAVRPEHEVQMFQLLGGGKKDGGLDGSGVSKARLAVLPGATHYTIFASPVLAATVVSFLSEGTAHS